MANKNKFKNTSNIKLRKHSDSSLRLAAGLYFELAMTQKDAAEHAGISRSILSKMVCHGYRPDIVSEFTVEIVVSSYGQLRQSIAI